LSRSGLVGLVTVADSSTLFTSGAGICASRPASQSARRYCFSTA